MNIEIEDSMYNDLIALSNEINNQNHRCTAMPYLFQIQEDFKIWDTGMNGSNQVFLTMDFDSEYPLTPEGVKEFCKDSGTDIPEDVEDIDYFTHEFFEKNQLTPTSYSIGNKLSNAFLTAKGCKEHIRKNGYHYNHATDYLSHAFRNPEMELIFKFICGLTNKPIDK